MKIEPFALIFDDMILTHTHTELMKAVVTFDWEKWGLEPKSFWNVRAQRVAYLSGNMEEAFS